MLSSSLILHDRASSDISLSELHYAHAYNGYPRMDEARYSSVPEMAHVVSISIRISTIPSNREVSPSLSVWSCVVLFTSPALSLASPLP